MTRDVPLSYASPVRENQTWRRMAVAAFVTALFAPLIAGGILYAISTFAFDIDDTLPRSGAMLFVATVAFGVPFAAAVAGRAAAARLPPCRLRVLAKVSTVIGVAWATATLVFLCFAFAA